MKLFTTNPLCTNPKRKLAEVTNGNECQEESSCAVVTAAGPTSVPAVPIADRKRNYKVAGPFVSTRSDDHNKTRFGHRWFVLHIAFRKLAGHNIEVP